MIPLKQEKHSSLIDIYKLIFAFIILYYHNCFVIPHSFNNSVTREVVCFFFLISGFYMYTSSSNFLSKHENDKHYLIKYIWYKLKKLGIPVLISYIASVLNTITEGEWTTGFMHYLWYIHIMLIIECAFTVLLKHLKIETINIIMGLAMIISTILYIALVDVVPSEIKALIFMPYGYFISCFNIKKDRNPIKFIALIITTIVLVLSVTNEATYLTQFILLAILIPLLFLIIVSIDSKSYPWTRVLSRISLVMYVYQSFVRWLGLAFFNGDYFNGGVGSFIFIMVLTVITIGIEHLIKYIKLKRVSVN